MGDPKCLCLRPMVKVGKLRGVVIWECDVCGMLLLRAAMDEWPKRYFPEVGLRANWNEPK